MIAEFEKVQIVNVSNRNLVDHNMKGIEYASCFETRLLLDQAMDIKKGDDLISFLDIETDISPVIEPQKWGPMEIGRATLGVTEPQWSLQRVSAR